ncbi:MAG TPA: hypothetical protein VH305_04530 [Gaiella sp.]
MALRLHPDPGPGLELALAAVLRDEGLLDATERASLPPWRQAALREGVAREPAAPRPADVGFYVAAPSPRSTRGATRA